MTFLQFHFYFRLCICYFIYSCLWSFIWIFPSRLPTVPSGVQQYHCYSKHYNWHRMQLLFSLTEKVMNTFYLFHVFGWISVSQLILRDTNLFSTIFDFLAYSHSHHPPCIETTTLYHTQKIFTTSNSKYPSTRNFIIISENF